VQPFFMEEENIHHNILKSSYFRSPNEFIALLFSFGLVLIVGYLLSLLNVFVLIAFVIIGLVFFRLLQARLIGESIRVHEEQFGDIYRDFKDYATQLGIRRAALYIRQDPTLNASTIGLHTCSVVLNSALVEQLTKEELNFVIAHELGHYKAGHTLISTLLMPVGSNNPYSSLIFGFWNRKAEYTSDRCGLLVTKNIDSAISGLLKLALGSKLFKNFNVEGYVAQIKKAQNSDMNWGELIGSHPLILNRIKQLTVFWKENFRHREM